MEARSQAEAKLKRERDDNDSGRRKSQRLVPSAEAEHPTKIIDLNDDCLMKVFGYLDLQCLFNVTIANEYLRPAARNVYTRKFAGKLVIIEGFDFRPNTHVNARSAISEVSVVKEHKWFNQINVTGLKTCLLYLRCLGQAISDLRIECNEAESKQFSYVHQYISDHCAATLTRITFHQMPNIAIGQFQKVFVRVEDVLIWDCLSGVQWSNDFVDCFPNLRRLKIWNVNMDSDGLTKSFEHLEHLEIISCKELTVQHIATDVLPGAHQLKRLEIYISGKHELSYETWLDMIKDKPLLTELLYDSSQTQHQPVPVNLAVVQQIINDHPALVELDLPKFQFTLDGINALIGQLNSLKKFHLAMRLEDYSVLKIQLENEWTSSRSFQNNIDHFSIIGSFQRIEQ